MLYLLFLYNYTCHYNKINNKNILLLWSGGDSKTLMIVQVAPVEKNVGETLASLSFAQRVRAIELGQATKKLESAEVTELKEKLAQYEVSL